MKRRRSLGGWCGLALAIAAVVAGAFAGKRYAEQHMLAAVLGSGVRAESVQWHWRQAAGCAEQVEIPLPNAKDSHQQTLQLYAPKLWFVYDQAALLRKRFILPRVVIEDAVISTSTDRVLSGGIVDIESGPGVDLGDLVELPSSDGSDAPKIVDMSTTDMSTNELIATQSNRSEPTLVSSSTGASQPTCQQLPWLDQLQALSESLVSDKSLGGRQVAIDTDMLSERMQDYFGDRRSQAQRLVAEARDLQQQLVNLDNVLRQPQLNEVARRLEQIKDQLVKLKKEIQNSGKLLDDQQSRVLSALLIEKKQLLQQADDYQAPAAREMAATILSQLVQQQIEQPVRAAILLADLMRKPLDASSHERGQLVRYLDAQQPEFAARSTRISGKLEMDGSSWPFEAQGKFEVSTAADSAAMNADSAPVATSGSAQWHMSIDAQPHGWQLDGDCPSVDGLSKVLLTTSNLNALRLSCEMDRSTASATGQIGWRQLMGTTGALEQIGAGWAERYQSDPWLRELMVDALADDAEAPEFLEFEVTQLPSVSDCQVADATINWLAEHLQSSATACMSKVYRQAAGQLESLIASRLSEQKGMTATLRNDAEQFVNTQQDELRRIQAAVNSLIEQQQTNYYFARQPGDMPR